MAALYFFLTISAFLSAAIVHKLGMYRCLVWGSLLTFVFTAVNILPALHGAYPDSHNILIGIPFIEAMLMIAAILNGLGGGILWCSLGKYISACATEETKGYYFGVFWFFYMGSQVVGSLLGAFILSEGLTQVVLFAVLALFGLIATFGMLYTRQPLAYKQKPLTTSVLLPRRVLNESQTTSDS